MPIGMSTANFITLSRLPLLLGVAGLLYPPWPWARYTALALLPVLFLMDWFDGYVARQKNQVTDLGSVLDIALDRVVENVVRRPTMESGKGYYLVGQHEILLPLLIAGILARIDSPADKE